jgi:hypothetical protein
MKTSPSELTLMEPAADKKIRSGAIVCSGAGAISQLF